MSYHLADIKRGELGKLSKIQEELDECFDAEKQNCKIMLATELSDLYGAVEHYAELQGLTMDDLKSMAHITKRAFDSGRRVNNDIKEHVKCEDDPLNFIGKYTNDLVDYYNKGAFMLINSIDTRPYNQGFNNIEFLYNCESDPIVIESRDNNGLLNSHVLKGNSGLHFYEPAHVKILKYSHRVIIKTEDIKNVPIHTKTIFSNVQYGTPVYTTILNAIDKAKKSYNREYDKDAVTTFEFNRYRVKEYNKSDKAIIQTKQCADFSIYFKSNYVKNLCEYTVFFKIDDLDMALDPQEECNLPEVSMIKIDETNIHSITLGFIGTHEDVCYNDLIEQNTETKHINKLQRDFWNIVNE